MLNTATIDNAMHDSNLPQCSKKAIFNMKPIVPNIIGKSRPRYAFILELFPAGCRGIMTNLTLFGAV